MIMIINGITYNTNTSIVLAAIDTEIHSLDNSHRFERLYRTRNGNYFLYGRGEPFSMFESWHGDQLKSLITRDKIMPITKSQAEEWVSRFNEDNYKEIFSVN